MKPLLTTIAAALLLFASSAGGNESPYCMTGVNVTASAEKKVFAENEPVIVSVTLRNQIRTLESISIAPEEFPFGYELQKLRTDGCWQPIGQQYKGGTMPDDSRWISLPYGQSHSGQVTIKLSNYNAGYVGAAKPICEKVSGRASLKDSARVYRVRIWHDGVRATDIRGNRPGQFGCATESATFQFEVKAGKSKPTASTQ
jgi:hypothetical protein